MDSNEYIRTRHICLKKMKPKGQAAKACALLKGLKGVQQATPITQHRLKLTYSLEFLTFELIEELLSELNFDLDMSMPAHLRRYYYQYVEDKIRDALVIDTSHHHLICSIDPNEAMNPNQYWDQYH